MTKEEKREYNKQWYIANRERLLKQQKEYKKQYYNTPIGRAYSLFKAYNRNDKKYNRGEGDLTPEWIVDNILSKPCVYCGRSGWQVIGCNRLDNSKPHTKDNVEPCCWECNHKLAVESGVNNKNRIKQVYQYSLDGKLVRVWESAAEAERNGFDQSHVSKCCLGKYKTHKGYRWSFNPL